MLVKNVARGRSEIRHLAVGVGAAIEGLVEREAPVLLLALFRGRGRARGKLPCEEERNPQELRAGREFYFSLVSVPLASVREGVGRATPIVLR